ncbi:ClpXP protease specificity-enhancing factor [Alginatibacterium sediminis]|uniref:ClpXP protease specificity-enhancing factor n=1 Tax=Alginatibacterium sediminis TaxID=2164068 RepID=A0A420E948_9ALTE|nr:ClpXP protease specificity-enhancing factor [Alginatibacterium sediminis]RKF15965.1 ClpXP protease specificity-enhancing factor [Alginatibacterium sediminis]
MTPNRPYLLRAFMDWLLDNDLTPHLVVNALWPDADVPHQFIQDGQIVLNIAPSAVAAFEMDLNAVSFNARFGGVPTNVYVPMGAVLAIYARENGAGTVFDAEPFYQKMIDEADSGKATPSIAPSAEEPIDKDSPEPEKPKKGKPSLRVIK